MHRSSECVAAIATALAKAQIELSNPKRSAVGSIQHHNQEAPQTFRYAPLSSGLEIIRKTLGGQQIAVAQTTDIDRTGGTLNLTTVLLHTSGEWIASEWPVCALSEISQPRRMGAALTYARRYALFTLVGIAGEDDLDAPDLTSESVKAQGIRTNSIRPKVESKPPIAEPASNYAKLIVDIESCTTLAQLTRLAAPLLKAKNQLTVEDAKRIEAAFVAKSIVLDQLRADQHQATEIVFVATNATKRAEGSKRRIGTASKAVKAIVTPKEELSTTETNQEPPSITSRSPNIEDSGLAIPKERYLRSKAHLKFVASHPCLICERSPADAHHLRFSQPRSMGRKVSDEFTVPLCRAHHRDNHRFGDERGWWSKTAIDPIEVSQTLWAISRHHVVN